jgi:hypothetical protein
MHPIGSTRTRHVGGGAGKDAMDAITTWPEVKPYPAKPLLNPTLVLRPKRELEWDRCQRLLREAATAVAELAKLHPHILSLQGASQHADDAFLCFEEVWSGEEEAGPTLEQEERDAEARAALGVRA